MEEMEPGSMIATCGINCAVCMGYLRQKNHCPGCNSPGADKMHHCEVCIIAHCPELEEAKVHLCTECSQFPCTRMKQLDKRYRTRYGTSLTDNLIAIRDQGMEDFLKAEHEKWHCSKCGSTLCIHREACPVCGDQHAIVPLPVLKWPRKARFTPTEGK